MSRVTLFAVVLAAGCGKPDSSPFDPPEPAPARVPARAVPTVPEPARLGSVHPSAVSLETVWEAYRADPAAAEIRYGRGVVVFRVKAIEKSPLRRWDVYSDDGGGRHVVELPEAAAPRLVGAVGKELQVPYVVKSSGSDGLVLKLDTQFKP